MGSNGEHHLMSLKTHYAVIGALFCLTVITVAVAQFDFGVLNVFIALGVATVKAYFVLAYFMHLKWDSVMNRVLIGSSFFFLALLAIFVFLDEMTRINPRL